jgi:hypothetical protein
VAVDRVVDRGRVDRLTERELGRELDERPRVREAMEWAGSAVSAPATKDDVDRYLEILPDLVAKLTR